LAVVLVLGFSFRLLGGGFFSRFLFDEVRLLGVLLVLVVGWLLDFGDLRRMSRASFHFRRHGTAFFVDVQNDFHFPRHSYREKKFTRHRAVCLALLPYVSRQSYPVKRHIGRGPAFFVRFGEPGRPLARYRRRAT